MGTDWLVTPELSASAWQATLPLAEKVAATPDDKKVERKFGF